MKKIAFFTLMGLLVLLLFISNVSSEFKAQLGVTKGDSELQYAGHGDFDQPDLFTGAVTYDYKISLPPGTNGMQPQLGLTYNSNNSNGWLGMGWELKGLAYVERSLKYGVPDYYDLSSPKNVYNLVINGASYELVRDDNNVTGVGFYHTKCESWMKIHFSGQSWTINEPNGRTLNFEFQVPIVDHPQFIRLWGVTQVKDQSNNFMTYTYTLDAANGEYYPDSIVYTNNENHSLSKIKTVKFLYENRNDNNMPLARWMLNRIKEIQIKIDGSQVDRYVFNYHESQCSYRSLLDTINHYGTETTPETTTMTYESDTGSLTWKRNNSGGGFEDVTLGDINGDGLTDKMWAHNVEISNGDGTYTGVYSNVSVYDCKLEDVNNDGLSDITQSGADGKKVFINQWNTITNKPNWVENSNWFIKDSSGFSQEIGDLNNDGILDRTEDFNGDFRGNYLSYLIEPGWGFNTTSYVFPDQSETLIIQYLEINGDGYADAYTHTHMQANGIIRINDKNGGWVKDPVWNENFPELTQAIMWDELSEKDFNGDGFDDLEINSSVYLLNNSCGMSRSKWTYYNSKSAMDYNGDGLRDLRKTDTVPADEAIYFRKPNGTRSSEIPLVFNGFAHLNDDPFLDYYTGSASYISNVKPDLLKTITLPTGGMITYDYIRVPVKTYISKNQSGAGIPPVRRGGTFRIYAISKITTNEGTGRENSIYTTSFEYPAEGAKFERADKQFVGFSYVRKVLPNNGVVDTYFLQKPEMAGRVTKVITYDNINTAQNGGLPLSTQEFEWILKTVNGSKSGYAILLNSQTELKPSVDHALTARTEYEYDTYGNVLTKTNLGDVNNSGDQVVFNYEYVNNDANWIIGLPKREKTSEYNGTKVYSDKLYYYDNLPYGYCSKGLLTEAKVWLDQFKGVKCADYEFWADNNYRPNESTYDPHPLEKYTYDDFGNRITTTKHNIGSYDNSNQIETKQYDEDAHCFVISETNAKNHTTSYTWNYRFGKPKTITDPNGHIWTYNYDGLGRLTAEFGPQDTTNAKTKSTYTNALTGNPANQYVLTERQVISGETNYLQVKSYIDGFGRVYREEKQAPEGKIVMLRRQYEWHGKIGKEWNPEFQGDPLITLVKTTVYDAIGRVVSVTGTDNSVTSFSYDGTMITITDANQHVTRQFFDAYNRLIREEKDNQQNQVHTTIYEYDSLGRQISMKDPNYNAQLTSSYTSSEYDSLGRLIKRTDSFMGTTNYEYDLVGNVLSKTDAKGNKLIYEYDSLNRIVAKSVLKSGEQSVNVLSSFIYDQETKGKLSSTCQGTSTVDAEYGYDAEGNLTTTTKHIGGMAYSTQMNYDALGRLTSLTYPDNTTISYTYDVDALKNVQNFVSYSNWNEAGLARTVSFGNGAWTNYTYNSTTLRLSGLETRGADGSVVQSFAYDFDLVGNISSIEDKAPLTPVHAELSTQTFTYDYLNRLTYSSLFGTYAYDPAGNVTSKEDVIFQYNDANHPYCPTDGSNGFKATYDENGNLAEKWDRYGIYWRYVYNVENMLTQVFKGPTKGSETLIEEYAYGTDGLRVKKVSYLNGTATTHYIYFGNNTIYENGTEKKLLIWAGNKVIAEVQGGQTIYNHPDHLGSTSVKTNGVGQAIAFVGTKPYGEFFSKTTAQTFRDDGFNTTDMVDQPITTTNITESKVVSSYTTQVCNEILCNKNYENSNGIWTDYVEKKRYTFTLEDNDYRRALYVEADIWSNKIMGGLIGSKGLLRVELVKPDNTRVILFSATSQDGAYKLRSANLSLIGLPAGQYSIVVSILGSGGGGLSVAYNKILCVTLTSKRVYQTTSELRTTALTTDFDGKRVQLTGSELKPTGTSIDWSVSSDGGSTWMSIDMNAPIPMELTQSTRQIVLRAVLTGTVTLTPVIDSYHLAVYGAINGGKPDSQLKPRFTGKESDENTGLIYFGARYYDPEVGRFTTVDPAEDGENWYAYCNDNPLVYVDPDGMACYVFYDSEAFSKQAQVEADRLRKEYNTEVIMCPINTNKQFVNAWDSMGVAFGGTFQQIDGVSLLFHGRAQTINIDYKTKQYLTAREDGKTPKGIKAFYIGDLTRKDIGEINIYSCNSGNIDYVGSNPASVFAMTQNTNYVYGWDGGLGFNWFTYTPRLTFNQSHFYDQLLYGERSPLGRIMYVDNGFYGIGFEQAPF